MNRDVAMALLETVELLDVVQVMLADNNGVLHLVGDAHALKDTSADGDVSSEGALLVDVVTFQGFVGGLEAKTGVTDVTLLVLVLTGAASYFLYKNEI